jgi:uncharacterized protein (DUF2252 family)
MSFKTLPNQFTMKKKEPTPVDLLTNKDRAIAKLWIYQRPRNERYEAGKQMRKECPRSSHAKWEVPSNRPDPVDLIKESNKGRIPNLVPLRHGRMGKSPFTFYRGAALNMASDLSGTPVTGMYLQACGDAHLCNFGGFATPERNVIFSINDLDETLPAPWEWDLKRLAASFIVACRNNNLSDAIAKEATLACVRSYRENMDVFSRMKTKELWHHSLVAEVMISKLKDKEMIRQSKKRLAKEKGRSIAEEIFPQLVKGPGEIKYIKDQLPSIFHWEGHLPGDVKEDVREAFALYVKTLPPGFNFLLSRYELKDAAIKVVGVGSVGTACWVILLMTGDGDTLFLQVKQAKPSVLEPYAGKSIFPNEGQRIVNGYRIMQPYSDPFLGWATGKDEKQYFIRQLRDIKISLRVETFGKIKMMALADWCGETLALSHARSGDAAMLSGYMGKSDVLDIAISKFAIAYANQNERDYAAFKKAIETGKIEVSYDE